MNILFDLMATQPNPSGKRHGGGKYGEIVFNRLVEKTSPIFAFYDSTKWINPVIINVVEKHKVSLYDITKTNLKEIVKKEDIDLIYTPLLTDTYREFDSCRVVATLHGLRSMELPFDSMMFKYRQERTCLKLFNNFYLRIRSKIRNIVPLRRTPPFLFEKHIELITVSNHSAFSIISFFPNAKFNINNVFYSPSTVKEINLTRKHDFKYFLLVSGNRWEKNNLRALIALDKLYSEGRLDGYEVVVTGVSSPKEYYYKIKNVEKMHFVDYVSDEELSQLYHDAYCLVYPSLNEGFGYPPLEAMCYGVPVIASPFASIPEICKAAVLYANSYSVDEIKNRVLMMTTTKIHNYYSNEGRKRYLEVRDRQDKDLDRLVNFICSKRDE